MRYFLNLFSPDTYEAFMKSDRQISGFRTRQRNAVMRLQKGDILLCYMTRLSRWFGVLEVISEAFEDDYPIFQQQNDPFRIRLRVKPHFLLPKDHAIPIHDESIWKKLSITKEHNPNTSTWTGKFRSSLIEIPEIDGKFLYGVIQKQEKSPKIFRVDEKEYSRLLSQKVQSSGGEISVIIPIEEDFVDKDTQESLPTVRESLKIQTMLAEMGQKMGFSVWIAPGDRSRIVSATKSKDLSLLEKLPLSYDETVIKTIAQIDVLWLRGRSIARAFEIEDTTAVYSGILRMADLLSLVPNMDINLHIVAPIERKDKVFAEIKRPVFSLLERGPLAGCCTYISYDSVRELHLLPHMSHLADSVFDEFAEEAE
jgi:hypothetical protein